MQSTNDNWQDEYPLLSMEAEAPENGDESALDLPMSLASNSKTHLIPTPPSPLLRGRNLALVYFALTIAFSLVALDQTIISTALPTIASHFNAVNDLSWVASGYFLSQAALMLFYGRVLAIASPKPVFLISIAVFEIGSLFCAVSPSVDFLILGRVVAGVGGGGLWVSIISIVAKITTVEQRPIPMGLLGAVFAVSSIVGPLLGGVFADHVSWRWCFYINLPLGAIAIVTIVIFLHLHPQDKDPGGWRVWMQLDWFGAVLNFAMVTTLLIALQWGGNEKPWNDPAVISLLVVSVILIGVFIAWEYRQQSRAILPLQLFSYSSITGACIEALFINTCFVLASYYLPFFYQIRGHSATRSGVDILPFMASGVFSAIVAGGIITGTGRPWPFLFFFPLIAAASFGLLFSVNGHTSSGRIAGFQILTGVGLGSAIQTVVVAQAIVAHDESLVALATSLITFMQLIGSAIGLAITGAVFTSELKSKILKSGAELSKETQEAVLLSIKAVFLLPPDQRTLVLDAYSSAVSHVFLIGIPAAVLGSLGALLITRRKIQAPSTGSTL